MTQLCPKLSNLAFELLIDLFGNAALVLSTECTVYGSQPADRHTGQGVALRHDGQETGLIVSASSLLPVATADRRDYTPLCRHDSIHECRLQGKRILSLENGFKIGIIPAGAQPFAFDPPWCGGLLLEKAEGEVA